MFEYLRLFFGLFCWLLVWLLAFWRGRWPERTAAGVTLFLGVLQFIVQSHTWETKIDYGVLFIDSALLVLFLTLAVTANRFWPIVAAGFQFIAVMVHFAFMIRPAQSYWVYGTVSVMAGYLVLIAFAAGLGENELRRKAERLDDNSLRDLSEP